MDGRELPYGANLTDLVGKLKVFAMVHIGIESFLYIIMFGIIVGSSDYIPEINVFLHFFFAMPAIIGASLVLCECCDNKVSTDPRCGVTSYCALSSLSLACDVMNWIGSLAYMGSGSKQADSLDVFFIYGIKALVNTLAVFITAQLACSCCGNRGEEFVKTKDAKIPVAAVMSPKFPPEKIVIATESPGPRI